MKSTTRRTLVLSAALGLAALTLPGPAVRAASGGAQSITAAELRTWLTMIASDDFEGRVTFSEGLGLAASYIASELKAMEVSRAAITGPTSSGWPCSV